MTAAILPACCAGADDGKIHPQLCCLGRACRGDFAAADSGADHSRVGAGNRNDNNGTGSRRRDNCDWRISHGRVQSFVDSCIVNESVAQPVADVFTFANSVADPIAHPDAKRITKPKPNADCDADANRFEFQRGIGQ